MNKSDKRNLWMFVIGVVMLAAGLFIFSQRVLVSSSFFTGWSIGGMHFTSGMIVIPLIAGVIWMFVTEGNLISKIFTGLSVLLIIVAVIMSTHISLTTMTLFEWILTLVLIFGGLALVLKVLLGGKVPSKEEAAADKATKDKISSLEKEIEELKKQK